MKRKIRNKVKFDFIMIVLVAIGAIVGGNIGSNVFNMLLNIMDESLIKCAQAIILAA